MRLEYVVVCLITIALLLGSFVVAGPQQSQPSEQAPEKSDVAKSDAVKIDDEWVSQTLNSLTLDEKIGQMFMVDANITFTNRDSEQYRKLENQVINGKIGGVILFRSQLWPTAVCVNRWQGMSKIPLFISADLEMGMGMRF